MSRGCTGLPGRDAVQPGRPQPLSGQCGKRPFRALP
ncbi:MAG: phage DNA packaging protein J [Chloroflexi bacterium]|nr:phage DNA packaging protein J [Chloroflexota bacterium]